MSNLSLKTSLTINAPAEKVWKALTDPDIIKEYFFGTDQRSDWKVGSPITWSGQWEGQSYEDKGEILEITPGTYVKYSYWSSMGGTEDKPQNYQNVSYNLIENDGVTTLEIGQENIKDEAAKAHSEQNWQIIFGKMKEMVEAGEVA